MRPHAPPAVDPDGSDPAADRRVRALEEPLDVRFRSDPRFVRLEVRNPSRGTRYTLALPAFPEREGAFCTCADFARRGLGTCKHLEAGWIWIREHPGDAEVPRPSGPADRSWTEIDRQIMARAEAPLNPATLRSPGATLLRR